MIIRIFRIFFMAAKFNTLCAQKRIGRAIYSSRVLFCAMLSAVFSFVIAGKILPRVADSKLKEGQTAYCVVSRLWFLFNSHRVTVILPVNEPAVKKRLQRYNVLNVHHYLTISIEWQYINSCSVLTPSVPVLGLSNNKLSRLILPLYEDIDDSYARTAKDSCKVGIARFHLCRINGSSINRTNFYYFSFIWYQGRLNSRTDNHKYD